MGRLQRAVLSPPLIPDTLPHSRCPLRRRQVAKVQPEGNFQKSSLLARSSLTATRNAGNSATLLVKGGSVCFTLVSAWFWIYRASQIMYTPFKIIFSCFISQAVLKLMSGMHTPATFTEWIATEVNAQNTKNCQKRLNRRGCQFENRWWHGNTMMPMKSIAISHYYSAAYGQDCAPIFKMI